jgi:hypothetical protein
MKIRYKVDEVEYELEFPITIEEIKFKQFVEFRAAEDLFFKSNLEDEEGNPIETEPLQRSIDGIDRMLVTLKALCIGDLKQLPLTVPNEDINELYKSGFCYTLNNLWSEELTLIRLYVHCVNIIRNYKTEDVFEEGKDYVLNWKDNKYVINQDDSAKHLLGLSFTAGEAITTLEFQKKTHQVSKKHGDPEGNLAFNLGLQEIAVLLRKPGEKLPIQRRKRIKFIDKRAKIFEDIPLDIIMDVRFFFLRTLTRFIKTRFTNFSLKEDRTVIVLRRKNENLNKHKNQRLFGRWQVGNLFMK